MKLGYFATWITAPQHFAVSPWNLNPLRGLCGQHVFSTLLLRTLVAAYIQPGSGGNLSRPGAGSFADFGCRL